LKKRKKRGEGAMPSWEGGGDGEKQSVRDLLNEGQGKETNYEV